MPKLIVFCFLIAGALGLQAQTANVSTTKNFLYAYDLPAKMGGGPMDIQVKGTYYFKRLAVKDKYLVYIVFEPGNCDFMARHGARRYKYYDVEYREDDMEDGLGSKGFDQIRIKWVNIKIEANNLKNARPFEIGAPVNLIIGETDKDSDLNNISLNIAGSQLVSLTYSGNQELELRLAALRKKKNNPSSDVTAKAESTGKSNSSSATNNSTSSNSKAGSVNKSNSASSATGDNYWNGSEEPTPEEAQKALKAKKDQEAVDRLNAFTNKQEEDRIARREKDARDGQLLSNSYYAAQAKGNVRRAMNEASTLAGTFESIEDLNAAYQQQMQAINGLEEQYVDAGRGQMAAQMDWAFKDADANVAAYKGLANGLGQLASDAAAERKAREARQQLQAERTRQEKAIKQRKWQALLNLRTTLVEKFPDGGVPLSFHKVSANDLYFFAYVFSKDSIAVERPQIMISTIFRIQRYGDNTWPFKNTILSELKRASGATKDVVMVGYYTDENEVSQLHDKFMEIAGSSQLNIKTFLYKGKKSTGSGGSTDDFWNKGNETTPKQPAPASGDDDYWNTGNKKSN